MKGGRHAMPDTPSDTSIEAGDISKITSQTIQCLRELVQAGRVQAGQLLVIGTSTSEVLGARIGTAGSLEAAQRIYEAVETVRAEAGFYPVYQCCEHLNRALVLEAEAALKYGLEPVSVIPVPKAGGSMASFAYQRLNQPVVAEEVQAHAGIDIGCTLIGMHLKRVAVPVRPTVRFIGNAFVQMAYTRPKLIGGERAVYSAEAAVKTAEQGFCN